MEGEEREREGDREIDVGEKRIEEKEEKEDVREWRGREREMELEGGEREDDFLHSMH